MSLRPIVFLTTFTLLSLWPSAAALGGQEVRGDQPAYLRVYLPADDAQLSVDGVRTKQTGGTRLFETPALEAGRKFSYTLRAEWNANGKSQTRVRKAEVEAGHMTVVDFREGINPLPRTEERIPDVVFVPTPMEVVDEMLKLANVHKGDVVYDLGCGDGRIVVEAAKKYGVKAVGFDIDPKRVKEAQENVRKNKVDNLVAIKQADIFSLDLRDASVVTLYLLPSLNVKLMPQLEKLRPGSRVVSHDFDMKGAKPKQVVRVRPKNSSREHLVYLWVVPWERE